MTLESNPNAPDPQTPQGIEGLRDFRALLHRILHLAISEGPALEFEREVALLWLQATGCDGVEIRLEEGPGNSGCRMRRNPGQPGKLETCSFEVLPALDQAPPSPDRLPMVTEIPLIAGDRTIGRIRLEGKRPPFSAGESGRFLELAEIMALALINKRAQWARRERVKELTCLYEMAKLSEREGPGLDSLLQRMADLIPPAWQYPEITAGRIQVDGASYSTPGFPKEGPRLTADIVVGGEARGLVEVAYVEPRPSLDEGPFLREERSLIDAIATHVALILERRLAMESKSRLEEQLRHADRLATIGQLAAGVAHELNEPLGAILGFAQLAQQSSGLPEQAGRDVQKILDAALHAREVVRKLMLFSRQMPPRKLRVNLNELVEEGLYFLESRCARQGVLLKRILDPDLPRITADRGQMQQILVNLAVNAVQAMPAGGTLILRTTSSPERVSLAVEDTGVGMTEEIQRQIFLPFFTTKDVGQGTGLGLSVVHGIVTAHGGAIEVESRPGEGSRFRVHLPLPSPAGETSGDEEAERE